MKKIVIIKIICLIAVCAFLNGCASTPDASARSQLLSRASAPPPGKATLYLFRPYTFQGGAVQIEVKIDGALVGRLGVKSYLCTFIDPGPHKIQIMVCNGENNPEPSQTIDCDVGRVLYLKGEWVESSRKSGVFTLEIIYTFAFKPVKESEGVKMINAYKLTDNEH